MSNALSAQGAAFLRVLEGFVDHWYADAVGVGTIGIGFTWRSEGFREWWDRNRPGQKFGPGAKMTRDEADKCLIFICEMEYGKAVVTFLGKTVKQSVFDGTLSPVFNLGPGSLKWKWAAAVKDGDLAAAATRLRSTGTTAGKDKKVLLGLVKRRREEADLIQFGDYKIGGIVDSDPLANGMLERGDRGKPVMNLQEALARRGLYVGKVDGIFGYGTEAGFSSSSGPMASKRTASLVPTRSARWARPERSRPQAEAVVPRAHHRLHPLAVQERAAQVTVIRWFQSKTILLQIVGLISVLCSLALTQLPGLGLDPKPRDAGRGSADLAWQKLVSDGSSRPIAFELEGTPPDIGFIGGDLYVLSGEAKGSRIALRALNDNVASLGVVSDIAALAKVKPGDEVRVDNSNFLAAQTYHRHQVPDASYTNYDQFRGADGKPLYPQRPMLLGPMFTAGAAGTVPSGKFNGRIILVQSGLDREAVPYQADWYARKFNAIYGAEAGKKYRLWFTENALHGHTEYKDARTRVVSYLPVLQQALRDLSAWVENGTPPPASSRYQVKDSQVILAATAKERAGIQPIVGITANSKTRAVVKAGQAVKLSATVTAPPGTGKVISAAWDFDDSGTFAEKAKLPAKPAAKVKLSTTHSFETPGTYFVTIKVESQRDGDVNSTYARIPNLARVRVVVE